MRSFLTALLAVCLSLPLVGCGKKDPVAEVTAVEEIQQEVKPEEPVAETKPADAVSVNPNLEYETEGDAVTITGCNKGTSGKLVIPATIKGKPVTSIGDKAFSYCRNLKGITIPNSVTSIGERAFNQCDRLTIVTIPDSVTSIGDRAFSYCAYLTGITIPDSVTSIGDRAFLGCTSLTSITIPEGVTSIGGYAFQYCEGLIAVTFLGDAPKAGQQVFKYATSTIYRKPEAKGWGDTFAGRPVKLISEKP